MIIIDESYMYDEIKPKINVVNGESHSRLYTIYRGIINRAAANSDKSKDSVKEKHKIYEKWEDNYFEFKSWALFAGYNDSLMLERIDKSKGYDPDNCQWVHKKSTEDSMSNDKLIALIEKAFKINLYDWQKNSLKGLDTEWPEGRENGRTFTHCIKLCLKACNDLTDKKNHRLA